MSSLGYGRRYFILMLVDQPAKMRRATLSTKCRSGCYYTAMTGSDPTGSRRVLRGLAVLVVIAMAFLAGMLVERLRLDARREDMLRRYNQVLQQYRDQQMHSEKTIQR